MKMPASLCLALLSTLLVSCNASKQPVADSLQNDLVLQAISDQITQTCIGLGEVAGTADFNQCYWSYAESIRRNLENPWPVVMRGERQLGGFLSNDPNPAPEFDNVRLENGYKPLNPR